MITFSEIIDKKMLKKNYAFTLAELLITLGVIGVVAALTIPNLLLETRDKELKVAWRKQYSVLSQAYNKILSENGGSIKNVFPSAGVLTDSRTMLNLFSEKMQVSKFCSAMDPNTFNCWHPWNDDENAVHYKNGDKKPFWSNNYPAMILNDGTLIHLYGAYPGGTDTYYGRMAIDVNGKKGPNIIGIDVFEIYLLENKLIPFGIDSIDTCETTGTGCSAKYLYSE